jgi:hypothetical protein
MNAAKPPLAQPTRRTWISPTVTRIGAIARIDVPRHERGEIEREAEPSFTLRRRVPDPAGRHAVTHP